MRRALDTVLLMLAALAIWQAMHWAAPFALTSPAGTAARAWQMLSSANFWPHAAETAMKSPDVLEKLASVAGATAAGDAARLRGLPAVSRHTSGAVAGSDPLRALLSKSASGRGPELRPSPAD